MKAAFVNAPNEMVVEEIPMHKIGAGEMLMKLGATSICGTDIRIYKNGHFKIPAGQRRVLGHELTGTVVELGANVKGYKKGDRIAMAPNIGCGVCDQCVQGDINLCADYGAFGITIDGGFQEYVVIPEKVIGNGSIIRIPEHISFEEAALAEPLSCVYNGYRHLGVKAGETVLVIGAGPIGTLHAALQRTAGSVKVMVADISDSRLEAMKAFGAADITINSSKEDLKEAVMKHTNGKGADIVIVAVSVAALQSQTLELAARGGRISFFAGLPSGKDNVSLATNTIHYRQLTITATTGSSYMDHRICMDLIASGRIDVKPLISKRYPVAQAQEAFDYAISGEGMKVFIVGE
ncbi:MAG: zinc-dependent dehydrogenase [Deferribacteraceae bacterium]|jgi:threonine dehydrogenase-like Zn-dependent dehydrogenase|nr:zinc-dependent dehydrogenase [Deferribacteraceae bacterium]